MKLLKYYFDLLYPLNKILSCIVAPFRKKRVISLIFHDVLNCQHETLKHLLKYAHKRYNFITPDDFELYLNNKLILSRNSILMTFDDGMQSAFDITKQYLDPLNIKAAFFVCPNYLKASTQEAKVFAAKNLYNSKIIEDAVLPEQLPMSLANLKELQQNGHKIGSHSLSHLKLSGIRDEQVLNQEIINSGDELGELLSADISWFAFPFGAIESIDPSSLKLIQKRYQFCFSGIRGNIYNTSHPMCLKRQSIDLSNSVWNYKNILNGSYDFFYRKKCKQLESMMQNI